MAHRTQQGHCRSAKGAKVSIGRLTPCGGAFPSVLGWPLGMPADRLGAGLPGGLRRCAASCQGELGKQSEQSSHSLHGQGL